MGTMDIQNAIKEVEWRIENCDYDLKITKSANNGEGSEVINEHRDNWEMILMALHQYVSFSANGRIQHLEKCMNPKRWNRNMSHAWHKNIPDVEAAFKALLEAAQ